MLGYGQIRFRDQEYLSNPCAEVFVTDTFQLSSGDILCVDTESMHGFYLSKPSEVIQVQTESGRIVATTNRMLIVTSTAQRVLSLADFSEIAFKPLQVQQISAL